MKRPLASIRPIGPLFKQQVRVNTEPIKRRLQRLGMQDIDESTMIASDRVVVEFRIPGDSPSAPSGLAGMRQLRSLYKLDTDGELLKFEYRMPTIVFGKEAELSFQDIADIKEEATEDIQRMMDEVGFYDTNLTMRGGGGIKDVGYTPHLIHPNRVGGRNATNIDTALDWLAEIYPKYMDEFDEEVL